MGLTMAWEDLYYLTSPTLDQCLVAVYDQGGRPQRKKVYEVASGHLNYPYVLFLSGSKGLVTVKNLQAPMDKNLILFRDSYGSSLAPLLASGYRTITLVDLRYLSSSQLDQYIDFEDRRPLPVQYPPAQQQSFHAVIFSPETLENGRKIGYDEPKSGNQTKE